MTVMQNFPQYGIGHFYGHRFYEGALHLYQVWNLYNHVLKQKDNEYKFYALLHGYDLDKAKEEYKENSKESNSSKLDQQEQKQSMPLFRDPSEYEDMSQEERDRLTKQMMGRHKQWAGSNDPRLTFGG